MSKGDHLQELEEILLTPGARRDEAQLSLLLAEEFREFGSSGRALSKREIIVALQAEEPIRLALTDFKAMMLSQEIALVTYRAIKDGAAATESLRSSVWVLRDARWQMVFHQGTKIPGSKADGPPSNDWAG